MAKIKTQRSYLLEITLSIILMCLVFVVLSPLAKHISKSYHYQFIGILVYGTGILTLTLRCNGNILLSANYQKIAKYTTIGILACSVQYIQYIKWLSTEPASQLFVEFTAYNSYDKLVTLLLSIILLPVIEEILFRGMFYRLLKINYGMFAAGIASISLFTIMHLFQGADVYNIVITGIIYTYVYEKSDSVIGSIITHSYHNGAWYLITYMFTNKPH